MTGPRRDTRGILDADGLMRRVKFRRHLPTPSLRPFIEHYWLIDWELEQPFEQHVVPHPSYNLVFQRYAGKPAFGEISGIGNTLFSIKLDGVGAVTGVQFRPGGYRAFQASVQATFPPGDLDPFFGADSSRVAALDEYLSSLPIADDPLARQAMALVEEIRHDRTLLRVAPFARRYGLSTRQLQRLFNDYVGVSPKWIILRYRIHEAIERAASAEVDWAQLALELGYSDQAHLVRDFTTTIGMSPTAYRRLIQR